MTGDPPSHPYVDMDREPIFRRVIIKEILRQAFEALPPNVRATAIEETVSRFRESVHGEFGPAEGWTVVSQDIQDWLNTPETLQVIETVLDALRAGTPWHQGSDLEEGFLSRNDLIFAK